MTYDAAEKGQGSPVELYKFNRGVSETYYLTSHDEDVTYQSRVYLSSQINRGKIERNSEIERKHLLVTIQPNAEVAANFIMYPPSEIMTLTIFRYHLNDGASEVITLWQGRVLTSSWKGDFAILDCEPVFTSFKRPGLRRSYQAQCPHVLYGSQCQVNNTAFQLEGSINFINENNIGSVAWLAKADGYYDGGYVLFNNKDFRTVQSFTAGVITLSSPIPAVIIGSSVIAFPGCGHNLSDCETKFNNTLNYGGFPYSSALNPFGGATLY